MIDPTTKTNRVCPLNGKLCINGIREDFPDSEIKGQKVQCRWWVTITGKPTQNPDEITMGDCAIAWLPETGLQNCQMSRHTAASVDKVANEVAAVKGGVAALGGAVRMAAASISQAVEAGALTVMLPAPDGDIRGRGANGHTQRELKEGKEVV